MNEQLLSLTSNELRTLAAALESGRLAPPYNEISFQRFFGNEVAHTVAIGLASLADSGCTSLALARVMEMLATLLDRRPPLEQLVDLVTTGPHEIEGATRTTSVVVSELFRNAETSVVVAGYAVRQGQKVFRDLADRMEQKPALRVDLYLDIQRRIGDTTLAEQLVRQFSEQFRSSQWPINRPMPDVYYDPRSVASDRGGAGALHAKCIVVDNRHLFISSANFTEAAQKRNIELGLVLDSAVLASRVTRFFQSLIQAGLLKRLL